MEVVPSNEVFTDTRNTKKTFLFTDAVCIECGVIFNFHYEEQCVICDTGSDKDIKCDHKNFITGKQSVDMRILLDFHIEDLMALCELHGCNMGSRAKMTVNIMKKLYPYMDDRINESLIRKIIKRNSKRFWYIKDIETALESVKSKKRLKVVDASECIEISDIKSLKKTKK